MAIAFKQGPMGLFHWIGIMFWGVAALPLGIRSVLSCTTSRVRQFPLATKLLACGAAWLFVIGWSAVAQGLVGAFSSLAGPPLDVGILSINISMVARTTAIALFACQLYLLLFVVSLVVLHFRQRRQIAARQDAV